MNKKLLKKETKIYQYYESDVANGFVQDIIQKRESFTELPPRK